MSLQEQIKEVEYLIECCEAPEQLEELYYELDQLYIQLEGE